MRRVAIVGVGRLGGALALALDQCGYEVHELITRNGTAPGLLRHLTKPARVSAIGSDDRIHSDRVIIATSDQDIAAAAASIAPRLSDHAMVFHTSGSLSSDVLHVAGMKGHAAGSIHPLIAVSDPVAGAPDFSDAYFCIEGTDDAVQAGREIVSDLGGHEIVVDTSKKSLYHAAAVMSAGHLVALLATAHRLIAMAGVNPDRGKEALLVLSRSAIKNLSSTVPEQALTGTFARLDIAAFMRHLDSLENLADDLAKDVYLTLGATSLELVKKCDENNELTEQFIRELNMAKAKHKC